MRGSILAFITETVSASVCHKGDSPQREQGSEGTNVVRSNPKPYPNLSTTKPSLKGARSNANSYTPLLH